MKEPVSRLVVNTPSTHGAVGATTGLPPAFTLGCGGVGGSASLLMSRRGTCLTSAMWPMASVMPTPAGATLPAQLDIEAITRMVIERLKAL